MLGKVSPVLSITHAIAGTGEIAEELWVALHSSAVQALRAAGVSRHALFFWNDWRYMLDRLRFISN
jgi:hypothetical protein